MNSQELREHVRRLNEQEIKQRQDKMAEALKRIRELREQAQKRTEHA